LLRVLGFDSKRGKIRAPWPPIYRGFGLVSKRILLRSRFDPSIEFVSTLVWIISMGKNLGLLRSWDEFGRPGDGGSGMTPRALDQLGWSVACRAVCSGAPAGRYAGCAQASGWADEKISAHG
jgi:hypothetical protein